MSVEIDEFIARVKERGMILDDKDASPEIKKKIADILDKTRVTEEQIRNFRVTDFSKVKNI